MKVYFLITGLLRTFITVLYPYLSKIERIIDCEFIVCTTNDDSDTKYTGISIKEQINEILKNKRYKLILENLNIDIPSILSQREKNTIYQWYHLQQAFIYLNINKINNNDIIIRIRPDLNILSPINDFINIIKTANTTPGIFIPKGNDLFSEVYRSYVIESINDQFALGRYEFMKMYCNIYTSIKYNLEESPIISEKILYNYLIKENIIINRIDLKYTIYLSECKIIAITGDSGVGKTTLVNVLQNIFPYDSKLILETDRYHKWERNHENWKINTHLNPNANYLEYMIDDTYKLKIGENIEQVNYDHSTGKFTNCELIESKPYIILCGLHTLYKEELRSSLDIKIFIDVEYNLKRYWKINRDIRYRGYSFEKASDIFNSRLEDYTKYILPQKEHADIIIHYYTNDSLLEVNTELLIECTIICNNNYNDIIYSFLQKMSSTSKKQSDKTEYYLSAVIKQKDIIENIPYNYNKYINKLEDSHLGIIQVLFILILFNK